MEDSTRASFHTASCVVIASVEGIADSMMDISYVVTDL